MRKDKRVNIRLANHGLGGLRAKAAEEAISLKNPMDMVRPFLRWLILILLGLAVYGQTFGFNFVFDDFNFIVNNPYIKRFDHVHYIWKVFPKTRTLGFYSFALNYHLNQLHPLGYHIFNFGVHLLATGLVWALAAVLFRIAGGAALNKELPFAIALLFLVHPGQTQAVTYIAQRFESMATVFYLATVYCYLCARISVSNIHRMLLSVCSAGFAILGILTKEVVATVPLMLVAAEFILLNRQPFKFKKLRPWQLYLLIVGLGSLFVILFIRLVRTDFLTVYFHFLAPSSSHDGDIITGGNYVLTQMRVFLTFMRLLILPVNQNVDYDYPLSTGLLHPPLTLAGLCLIGFIVFLIFRLRKEQPLVAFGLAWILITFSINTAPRTHVIFEHKLYLISFGFFLSAVCVLANIIKNRNILSGFLIVLIMVLSLASYKRNQVWQNQLTLWSDVIQKSPYKARPYNSLAVAYDQQGDLSDALINFNKAIAIRPFYEHAYNGRGNVYSEQGNSPQALSDYNRAIAIKPDYADAYYNRGIFYEKHGELTQALSDYNKAIALNPDYPEAYFNRGNIYKEENNFIRALSDYNKAIEDNPDYEKALMNRGNIYSMEGDFTKAISDYNEAIGISPDYAEAYYNRAVTYYQLKEYGRAWEDVHEVESLGIKINPRFLEILQKVSGP